MSKIKLSRDAKNPFTCSCAVKFESEMQHRRPNSRQQRLAKYALVLPLHPRAHPINLPMPLLAILGNFLLPILPNVSNDQSSAEENAWQKKQRSEARPNGVSLWL